MGAVASMLKDDGYEVQGSDDKVYPPISDFLNQQNIKIFKGFSEKNLVKKPDLVIIGNAVSKDNVEVQTVKKKNIPYMSMPEAINFFFTKNKKALVVTGTHGKTTISSTLAWILQTANLNPSFIIGGILKNFNSNYKLSDGEYIVLEGDEYNTSFFDKRAKFMHYNPYAAIVNNIEFDHADIFNSIEEIKETFTSFLKQNKDTQFIAFDNDKNIDEVINRAECKSQVTKFGKKETSDWHIKDFFIKDSFFYFTVFKRDVLFDKYKVATTGEHNVLNILSVIALCDFLGVKKEFIKEGLKTFKGVKRRQEIRGVKQGITIIDDFAHHPTAVQKTIKGIKKSYKHRRVIALFEPRTNSSMRKFFQNDYVKALSEADIVCIKKAEKMDKISYKERFSIKKVTNDLKKQKKEAYFFLKTTRLLLFLKKSLRKNDIVLVMSNGGFDNIHNRILDML